MKLKMFSKKSAAHAVFDAGGLLAGGMLSSGIEGAVPIDDSKTRKGVLAIIGIIGAASIDGDSTMSKLARNVLLGMSVRQGQRFIQEAATPTLPEADGSTMNKFMHDMLETSNNIQITKPAIEPRKRMGMGYRFTPKNQVANIGSHQKVSTPHKSSALEFPLT